ncbi:MAG: hypothetical protein ACKO5K_01630 [Armatimonadota bacterium]
MSTRGRRPVGLAATFALLGFAVAVFALIGFLLVVAGRRSPDRFARSYDLPPVQTAAFVSAASTRLEWKRSQRPGTFETPDGVVTVRIDPVGDASNVIVEGPRRGVRALADFLDRKIPPLP